MTEETQANPNAEVALTGPGGVSLRAKGYRLVDLLFIIGALGLIWGAWELKTHAGDAARQGDAIVKSINDANAAPVKALQELAAEQKKSTNAMREIACLSDPAMRNRADARDFCKRMSRDER